MLAERNMPFRVQFVIYTSDYIYENMDWFVRPEVQADLAAADLIFAGLISSEQTADYIMPLTDYVTGNAMPSLKNAVPHDINWQQTSVNGEIYGISQIVRRALSLGWTVDDAVTTECGLTIDDFHKDYWELDKTLKKLMELSGNRKLIEIPSNSTLGSSYNFATGVKQLYPGIAADPMRQYFTSIGSIFAVEYINKVPTVVNMLDTGTARRIQDAILRYRDTYAAQDDGSIDIKLSFSSVRGHLPFQKTYGHTGESFWYIPVSAAFYNASPSVLMQNVSGVAVTSQYQKEAVTLLSLIAEDEEFRIRLMFGKEGRDYTINANGSYCAVKQMDGSVYNMSFLSPWSNFSGMQGGERAYPGTEANLPQYEGMTTLETYLEMIENAEAYYAVPFDFSGLQKELNEVYAVCQLYFYRFASLTEEKYAEMLQKIADAGGDKIMTELQRQLDEWVKANPGKPVTPNRS